MYTCRGHRNALIGGTKVQNILTREQIPKIAQTRHRLSRFLPLERLYNNFEIPDKENDTNKNQNWFKASVTVSKRNKVILGLSYTRARTPMNWVN